MLIEIKRHEASGISKRALSGINHNSIVKWRKQYNEKGIAPLLVHGRVGGFKKSMVSTENHKLIEKNMNEPNNGIRGYMELLDSVNMELLDSVNMELKLDIKYITPVKYTQRHFGANIKVARKSHVKKDEDLVSTPAMVRVPTNHTPLR